MDSINEYGITSFKIESLLDSFNEGTVPRLDELSEMLEISTKTIERNLKAEGVNFLHLKQKFLARKSFELLQDPNLSVKEISEKLDYLHSQNFIRSFKKWTGMSPAEYRHYL